jgi:hypothetical protein
MGWEVKPSPGRFIPEERNPVPIMIMVSETTSLFGGMVSVLLLMNFRLLSHLVVGIVSRLLARQFT